MSAVKERFLLGSERQYEKGCNLVQRVRKSFPKKSDDWVGV